MSEQILKALMQLFAIIARPENNAIDRREVVASFLARQLNQELVNLYLEVFDDFYNKNVDKSKSGERKREGVNAVKIIRICTQINDQLTQKQKIIVLYQLFEFSKSNNNLISGLELEFIITVAEVFNIPDEEHIRLKEFVVNDFENSLHSDKILVIDSNIDFEHERVKHLYKDSLEGQVRVLFVISAGIYLFRYTGSGEMYLNGQIVQNNKVYIFNTGSAIRNQHISPIYYSDIVGCFHEDKIKTPIDFVAKGVSYVFKNGKIGLQDISFQEQSGHMVAIMGASGAGKTTLLNTLNGMSEPTSGEILINGVNIHTQKKEIEGLIGFVSQDDLLIEDLTVHQNLYYNAKLCFDNYTDDLLGEVVERTLQNLGLFEIKDIQVGSPLNKKISGGQRKRLNIALELIREPSVLFLDEPTSGLSSRDSENIMDLLKELSLKGKLVFVVIHQPSSDIFKMFDNLIILDTGGYLIYFGKPIDSIMYFKEKIHHANWAESECQRCGNVNPEQLFNIVESNVLDEYGKPTRTRKITPEEWKSYYQEHLESPEEVNNNRENSSKNSEAKVLPDILFKIPNRFKQFLIFATRDIMAKLANTQYLFINLFEAPLLGFILAFIIKYRNVGGEEELGYTLYNNSNLPVYIFMSVIVAIFIGLSVSAEEIIKDRKILKREAFLNLSWSSYLLSKAFVLTLISALQAFMFVMVGNSILEIKGMYWQYWLVLFSAWVASNMMGLVISDSFKTVVTIYILIPFLVIPQILLSGVIVKYEKLNPSISSPNKIPWFGEAMTARWGYEALAVYQFMENKYTKELYPLDKVMSIARFKNNYWVPNLRNKIEYVERNLNNPDERKANVQKLEILRNEISQETAKNKNVPFAFEPGSIHAENLSPEMIEGIKTYIKNINKYYVSIFNQANGAQDKLLSSKQGTPQQRAAFLELKKGHHNEKLEEFVENDNELIRSIDFNGKLYQKIDPVYLDPEPVLLKAHFYSPRKFVFGKYQSTFMVNILVIWLFTFTIFIILYFRLVKKLLDGMEKLSMKLKKE
jgi:ABC transport system ATP-binding/permease protein